MFTLHQVGSLSYRHAPAGWLHAAPHPLREDGTYPDDWHCFAIRDADDSDGYYARWPNNLFGMAVGRSWPHLTHALCDFLRYENAHGRTPLLAAPQDVDLHALLQCVSGLPEAAVRPHDPPWIVHTTTATAWTAIQACGELRSLQRLRREGHAVRHLAAELLGEPEEYAEYVMFARVDSPEAERIVASHLAGSLIDAMDAPYTPGARLYLDAHRIIRDGLVVRDGLHEVKVHDHLPLGPYLQMVVTRADVDPDGSTRVWTPESFCAEANRLFWSSLPAPTA